MQQKIQSAVGSPESGPAIDVGEFPDVETGALPVSHITDTPTQNDENEATGSHCCDCRNPDQRKCLGSGKVTLPVALMLYLIRFYQKAISPYIPCCCRFEPSCSHYSAEAFRKRGFFAGMILTLWRLLRCQPFCRGGYDPVPDKGFHRVAHLQHRDTEEI